MLVEQLENRRRCFQDVRFGDTRIIRPFPPIAYQLRHGQYPATLAQLTPAFLDAEPVGIVNRFPLHLSISQPSAPLIYSAGWDAKNDSGAQDDIVLKLPVVGRR